MKPTTEHTFPCSMCGFDGGKQHDDAVAKLNKQINDLRVENAVSDEKLRAGLMPLRTVCFAILAICVAGSYSCSVSSATSKAVNVAEAQSAPLVEAAKYSGLSPEDKRTVLKLQTCADFARGDSYHRDESIKNCMAQQ